MKTRLFFFAALMTALMAFGATASAQNCTITRDAIGPVKLGMSTKALPKSVDGLYDKIEKISSYNEMEDYEEVFYKATLKGQDVLFIYEDDGGNVYSIDIYGKQCKTAKGYSVDTPVSTLFNAGAKAFITNEGYYGLLLNDILFGAMKFSQKGMKTYENAYLNGDAKFTASDFVAGNKSDWIRLNKYNYE